MHERKAWSPKTSVGARDRPACMWREKIFGAHGPELRAHAHAPDQSGTCQPAGNQTDQMVRTGPADNLFAWLAPMTPPRWGKHGFRPSHDLRRMSRTWTIFFLMGTACMHAIAARDDPIACHVSTKTCAAMHAATTGFAPARPAAEPSGAHWSMSRRLVNFFCDRTSLRARPH